MTTYYEESYPPSLWAPKTTTISPTSMVISTSGTVTVNGTGFVSGNQIVIGGIVRTTVFVSSTRLTCTYTAPGTAQSVPVLVRGSAGDSNAQSLTITATAGFAAIPVEPPPEEPAE